MGPASEACIFMIDDADCSSSMVSLSVTCNRAASVVPRRGDMLAKRVHIGSTWPPRCAGAQLDCTGYAEPTEGHRDLLEVLTLRDQTPKSVLRKL